MMAPARFQAVWRVGLALAGVPIVAGALCQPADPDLGGLRLVLVAEGSLPRVAELAIRLDPLSCLAALVVVVLASAAGRNRRTTALVVGGLVVVLSGSLLVLWLGWLLAEMGTDHCPHDDQRRRWVLSRIGDAFLLLGMLVTGGTVQTLSFFEMGAASSLGGALSTTHFGLSTAGWILTLSTAGASLKIGIPWSRSRSPSAALAASAFGLFMLYRLAPLLRLSGLGLPAAWAGAVLAAAAACAGLRVPPRSQAAATAVVAAQAGFVLAALGVGAPVSGTAHMLVAAFLAFALLQPEASIVSARQRRALKACGWAATGMAPLALALPRARLYAEALNADAGTPRWWVGVALTTALGIAAAMVARAVDPWARGAYGRAPDQSRPATWPLNAAALVAVGLGLLELPGTLWRQSEHNLLAVWLAGPLGHEVDASGPRLALGVALTCLTTAVGWACQRSALRTEPEPLLTPD